MTDVLASEWAKLRSGRPMRYALGVLGLFTALMLGLAVFFVVTWDSLPPGRRAASSLGSLPELLGWIASLVMAVLGALAISTELASGMIRTTFLAVPARERVLGAKALVVGGVAFVATATCLGVTVVGAALIVAGRPIHGQGPVDLGSLAIVVAQALSAAMFALIGLALGTITRSAVASVVTLVLGWYVLPLLALHAPAPWDALLGSVLPGALAQQLAGSDTPSVFGTALGQPGALVAMLAYAVLPLLAAGVALRRRDA